MINGLKSGTIGFAFGIAVAAVAAQAVQPAQHEQQSAPSAQAAPPHLALAVPRDPVEQQRPFELGCGLLLLALGCHDSFLAAALRSQARMRGLGADGQRRTSTPPRNSSLVD